VSIVDQGTINQILEVDVDNTRGEESGEYVGLTQQILSWVAQYSEPVREIQRVCNHQEEIMDVRTQITILLAQRQPTLLECCHNNYETQLQTLRRALEEARYTASMERSDEDV